MGERAVVRIRPRRWSHWTLRSRLVLVVGALAAVALLLANAAGVLLIRSYLLDRIDRQLAGAARHAAWSKWPGVKPGIGPDHVSYVYRPDGTLQDGSSPSGADRPPVAAMTDVMARAETSAPFTVTAADGTSWRMVALRNEGSGQHALVGVSLAEVDQTTEQLLLIDAAVSLLLLGLLGVGAAFVVRLGLRPLTAMERVATAISAGNLGGRVAGTDPHTEPGRLGLALNAMLGRIEGEVSARAASEQRLRQFVADASHELRTPLTSIRGFAELYRRGGVAPGPALDRIEAEASRMSVLVEDMLMLARLDQQRPPTRRPVDLLEVAADTVRDAHARVPERQVRLGGLRDDEDTFAPATVLGDEHELRQVAANLVANALQHTPPTAGITVRIGRIPARAPLPGSVVSGPAAAGDAPLAVLEVADDGPGVPAAHAPRIFERLYRVDSSRRRGNGGGSGLGLSIVAAIVASHGGWVELDTAAGRGATFRVLLPADEEPVPG